MAIGRIRSLLSRPWVWAIVVLLAVLFVLERQGYGSLIYTPGDRFRAAMKAREAECKAERTFVDRYDRSRWEARCKAMLGVQVEDWLATPEGRFAHSIRIPNPVPEDGGYRWWMRPRDYFEHLCRTEAGEFIFKPVDKVEGLRLLRPRVPAEPQRFGHLYAMEDPYGHLQEEAEEPGDHFLGSDRYAYIETPLRAASRKDWLRAFRDASLFSKPEPGEVVERYTRPRPGEGQKGVKLTYGTQYKSRYAVTWRGIRRPHDREMGIAGGELIVLDLETNELLGVRRGYALFAGQWELTPVCPTYGYFGGFDKATAFTPWFTMKVARPPRGKEWFGANEKTRRIRPTSVGPLIQ